MWGWRWLSLETRRADRWNPVDFMATLGPLVIWSGLSPKLGIWLELDDTGLRVQLHLPYVHLRLDVLPFPRSWGDWSMRHLWRDGGGRR